MEEKLAKQTVQEIKKRFPAPMTASCGSISNDEIKYCVGGAFICSAKNKTKPTHHTVGFPGYGDLVSKLKTILKLSDTTACDIAGRIIGSNDNKLFDTAWTALQDALILSPRKTPIFPWQKVKKKKTKQKVTIKKTVRSFSHAKPQEEKQEVTVQLTEV